ncbi:DUF1156 domain-containing protein [Dermacoccus abyssi]
MTQRRKMIEVALPLEAINKEAAREKSIRHGHPSTLHLWWARRPLAAARAVLFAQLVDDPASTDEALAITDEAERDEWVARERTRLFRLIEDLVKWENSTNETVLNAARAEIMRCTGGNPPPILDPFAGGGTIPLEAQRLGLEAHASDLNPVAVLINKALIEIPPKFADSPPVFPGAAEGTLTWPRATGLAEDVRRYGAWMRDEAEKRIGHLYPKATLDEGSEADVIAWIWARTVTCPNPACGIEMPLVRSWWLGKKKGKEAYVVPTVVDGKVGYSIGQDPKLAPPAGRDGTVGRTGAVCIACATAVPLKYVRERGKATGLGSRLMAVVAQGGRRREYLAPTDEHVTAAKTAKPLGAPEGRLAANARDFKTPNYGLDTFESLFTNRQLTALTTFSDLVGEARERVLADALEAGMPAGARLESGGSDAEAYADAVATYLGLAVSRTADLGNSLVTWSNGRDQARNLFARQAIPMAWDFVEVSPFARAAGDVGVSIRTAVEALEKLPGRPPAVAVQQDAVRAADRTALLSTDPPYYDNIGYSDLSDFFYVWLRRSLGGIQSQLLSTMLVPKVDELVANPYRHGGKAGAKAFFEEGFREVFSNARQQASDEYPIAVYYAFKQSEADISGTASTGWETLLEGMVRSGWMITGTWPMRSERGGRMISVGTNALASSIVLALRPRPEDAPMTDRRAFLAELRDLLPEKLKELQSGSIAPVDVPQAAIGPGMAIFSSYSRVVEADGSTMTVRSALQVVNQVLGEVLSSEEGDFDAATRWALKWYDLNGFGEGAYGDAENLSAAYAVSVAGLARSGILRAGGGRAALVAPIDLPEGYDPGRDDHISLWEVTAHLARALDTEGLAEAGRIMARAAARIDLDEAKQLAYLVFSRAEARKDTKVARLYNQLAASWPDVVDAGRGEAEQAGEQLTLDASY